MNGARTLVVGGAGFIGSHVVDRLLALPETAGVTVYDNFSSGRDWHLEGHAGDRRLLVHRAEVGDLERLVAAMAGHAVVVHLASNPDIARAAREPAIDFDQGTVLTHHVLEAMRRTGCGRILYASGSGIYGDLGDRVVDEDQGPLRPISTYGASKLAGEAMICSYAHMFGIAGLAFRFGNVVGPRQTHGVGFDFIRRLRHDPTRLAILGDGSQSKPYVHVDDVVDAMLLAGGRGAPGFHAYNVAPEDAVTVREIADLAVACLGLPADSVAYEFAGGDRGWKGDVPVVRLDTRRIRALGWRCGGSGDAMMRALAALRAEAEAGRI
ncbi:MAG: NAD-dependent epimerase/dehydratase family protein [Dongiaceae bacterium]